VTKVKDKQTEHHRISNHSRNLDRKSEPQPKSHPLIPLASGHQCMLWLFNISTE